MSSDPSRIVPALRHTASGIINSLKGRWQLALLGFKNFNWVQHEVGYILP